MWSMGHCQGKESFMGNTLLLVMQHEGPIQNLTLPRSYSCFTKVVPGIISIFVLLYPLQPHYDD